MSILQKKREAFRQSIRTKTIQQIFRTKRLQILQDIKKHNELYSENNTNIHQNTSGFWSQHNSQKQIPINTFTTFQQAKQFLSKNKLQIHKKTQLQLFDTILRSQNLIRTQKLSLISKLINRKQFKLDQQVEEIYGWRKLCEDFLSVICENQLNGYQISINEREEEINKNNQLKILSNMICYTLVKIWQIKPKHDIFYIFPKSYQRIYQKISNIFGLSLIAQLTYQKNLMPHHNFIYKILQSNIITTSQSKFFRILQILKNYLNNIDLKRIQIHIRQLIFQYFNWIKKQIKQLNSQSQQPLQIITEQQQSLSPLISTQTIPTLPQQTTLLKTQNKYCLIYLLFITLNKLNQLNQIQKNNYSTKQIIIMNEQLFNHTENHTLLKFLIQEGKLSIDNYHKINIFKTLNCLLSFLEIINQDQEKYQNIEYYFEFQEIQKTFSDVQFKWYETFN